MVFMAHFQTYFYLVIFICNFSKQNLNLEQPIYYGLH